MTTLKFEPLPDDISMKDLAMFDSKANILESFKLMNFRINRNYKKEELASVLEQFFMQFPGAFANILPRHEITIMAELLENPQSHYVEYERDDDHFLLIQKLHLVVTYETKDRWHIYVPDSIRKRLNDMLKEDIKRYPELEEYGKLIDKANKLREEADTFALAHFITSEYNVGSDPKPTAAKYAAELKKLKQDFQALVPRLSSVPDESMQRIYDNLDMYIEDMIDMANEKG